MNKGYFLLFLSVLTTRLLVANAGFMKFPFFSMSMPWMNMNMNMDMDFMSWYKGDNVCKDEKVTEDQFPETGGTSTSEQCQGNNYRYVCVSRTMQNGHSVTKTTTYECCPGFERPLDNAPGCIPQGSQNT